MSHEENRMEALYSSSDELVNELEKVLEDNEQNEESKFPRRRLDKKSTSVPNLVDEGVEDLDDDREPAANVNDKVGKKRQRKKDESGLEKTKRKRKRKKKQDSENSAEIKEMWDSITNDKNTKDGDKVVVNSSTKEEDKAEIAKLFGLRKKKKKVEKTGIEIAMQVEEVMAKLEIAGEDDVILNREGKPAINKLMNLPLLNEALVKKPLQDEFLDHGVLNLLKNWLEPLPDGSLPNITIRTTVLKILNDLQIKLDQDSRRDQLIKSGLGKVIMFLSKSKEETTPNRRLANDLVNKWGRIIYNKSTRYDNMYSREELEEHERILLRREIKTAPKVSKTKARDFNVDVDLSRKPKFQSGPWKKVGRAQIPTTMSMDFKLRPHSKFDKEHEDRVNMQIDKKSIRENIIKKLKQRKILNRNGMQAFKPSADGRTMFKYL